jgi:heat shock protein HtpX
MAMWGSIFGGRDSREALPLIILVAVTAPIAAMIVQSAISRSREFAADARGAEICGNPRALASALEKLERGNEEKPMEGKNPAHASLFISNPFRGGLLSRLFSTHPPMDERIERLNDMAY